MREFYQSKNNKNHYFQKKNMFIFAQLNNKDLSLQNQDSKF